MTAFRVIASRLRALFSRRRRDAELDEELQCHLDLLVEENVRRGMHPDEARYQARREFGGLEQTKETYREARGIPVVETTVQDLRYALRMMRRKPGFTATVVAVLALGIGANTVLFSILNTFFLRPLPYPDAPRLVMLGETQRKEYSPGAIGLARQSNFTQWRAQNQVFESMAAIRQGEFNVNARGEPERVRGERVSEDFFRLLGVAPALGRTFEPDDFAPSAEPVVVISHKYWRRTLNRAPDVAGRVIRIEGRAATVIGVMPESFRSSLIEGGGRFWMPLEPAANETAAGEHSLRVIARLKPGVSVERARNDMNAIALRLEQERPAENRDWAIAVEGMMDHFVQAAKAPVARVLVAAVWILLLIACANVANLLLVRGLERHKEIALRLAMGASRFRLIRQLMMENLLLALIGGLAGTVLAFWAVSAFSKLVTPLLADVGIEGFEIDGRVLLFTLGVSVLTGLLFGGWPAIRGSGIDVVGALKEAGIRKSGGGWKRRPAGVLVTAELALSLVLLVTAALVLESVRQSWSFNWGFPLKDRVVAGVSPSQTTYATPEKRILFFTRLLDQMGTMPGVRVAALASSLPTTFLYPNTRVKTGSGESRIAYRIISPDYLRALAIPLRRGRPFDGRDTAESDPVAVVNESAARALWKGTDPIGQTIEVNGVRRTVVGVAADIENRGLTGKPGRELCVPYTQDAPAAVSLLLHHDTGAIGVASALPKLIHRIDRDQPVFAVRSLEAAHAEVCGPLEFALMLVGSFAAVALVLSAAGVYGVAAYSVSTRTRDIGIRIALGASRRHVVSQILAQGLRWALIGCAIGAAGAFALGKILISKVWWIKADMLQLTGLAALLLGVIAVLACYVPARRATRIDPAEALRAE